VFPVLVLLEFVVNFSEATLCTVYNNSIQKAPV
jgi:hypothetical protein